MNCPSSKAEREREREREELAFRTALIDQ
jgi:hypothetical protein